ncbi:MAG: PD-(D/E)XK nuclease-like domain-containing protein [Pseudomonadota bacterium]
MTFQQIGDALPPLKITEPGKYKNISLERYHNDTELFDGFSISSTGIKQVVERPSLYWAYSPYNPDRFEKKSNKNLDFGRAAHHLLLSEVGFARHFALRPEKAPDGRVWHPSNNSCKAWLEEQASLGKTVITQEDIDHLRHMRNSLARNPLIFSGGILNGEIEQTLVCRYGGDKGLWLKSRPDIMPSDGNTFVDLKTAHDLSDEGLEKAIHKYGYYLQAALMRIVARTLDIPFEEFVFVFVETKPPYDVRVEQLKDNALDIGERDVRQALRTVEACISRGEWPGHAGFDYTPGYVDLPYWATQQINQRLQYQEAAE